MQKPELQKRKKKKNKKARKIVDQAKYGNHIGGTNEAFNLMIHRDLGWEENENRHIVIKNMFDPKEALVSIFLLPRCHYNRNEILTCFAGR